MRSESLREEDSIMLAIMLRILIAITTGLAVAMVVAAAAAQEEGAFDKLSPGNQKIARALFDAQTGCAPAGSNTCLTRDQIASMKTGDKKGWGQVFKDMKAQGLLQDKTLGQVVSRASRQTSSGTTATGTGKTDGKGSLSQDNAGKGGLSGGPGRGVGVGHRGGSGSSVTPSSGSHGVGRGK